MKQLETAILLKHNSKKAAGEPEVGVVIMVPQRGAPPGSSGNGTKQLLDREVSQDHARDIGSLGCDPIVTDTSFFRASQHNLKRPTY